MTDAKELIGGIDVTAPMWRKVEPRELRAIVSALSSASGHYADDSSREWGCAGTMLRHAAMEVNRLGLGHYAITALHRDKPQLVTMEQFMDAILKDARK